MSSEVVMRLLKRDHERAKSAPDEAADTADTGTVDAGTTGRRWRRRTVTVPVTVPERAVRRTAVLPSRTVGRGSRRASPSLASMVAIAVGAALAIVGSIVLIRTGVDETWFEPRAEVLEADHTALLGALEIAAGVALMIAGATGSRVLVAFMGLALAIAAAAVAIEPAELQRELAIERWWAWALAGTGAVLILSAVVAPFTRRRAVVEVA
jgi:hypothetical protein